MRVYFERFKTEKIMKRKEKEKKPEKRREKKVEKNLVSTIRKRTAYVRGIQSFHFRGVQS